MHLTTFIIFLILSIILSNLLDSVIPRFPLPLIQILFGVIIAVSPANTELTLNPEIFMGLLIAPLLFREAEDADISDLWRVRKPVIFMVFGLVFLTVFAIGFSVHLLTATIPLAACFALGAALGPTDPVAVSTVASRITIDDKVMNVLKGEWLINDATGVISFNFAILALVTGTFSLASASLRFLILCLGGIVLGLLLVEIKSFILRPLNHSGLRNTPALMLIEILMPFICFYLAEAIHVSGIIAAVTAGSRQALKFHTLEIHEAEFQVFKKSMWEMVTVTFNSFIFVLLGLKLPRIVTSLINDHAYSVESSMLIALFTTAILFLVRFLGTSVILKDIAAENFKEKIRNWVILTLSGVKGTVSLATAFAFPLFIQGNEVHVLRDFILFITGCTIIYSLIIATVLLPIIAKPIKPTKKNENHIKVLNELISEIESIGGDFVDAVIHYHKRRIKALSYEDYTNSERKMFRNIRNDFFKIELEEAERDLKNAVITPSEFIVYCDMLAFAESVQKGSMTIKHKGYFIFKLSHHNLLTKEMKKTVTKETKRRVDILRLQEIFWENHLDILDELTDMYGEGHEALMQQVIEDRIDIVNAVSENFFRGTHKSQLHGDHNSEIRDSFDLERTILNSYVHNDMITDQEAEEIRKEINIMENYTLEGSHNAEFKKVILQRASKRVASRLGLDDKQEKD